MVFPENEPIRNDPLTVIPRTHTGFPPTSIYAVTTPGCPTIFCAAV